MNPPPDTWLIRNGRLIDPAAGRDETGDLYIRDGRIAAPPAAPDAGIPVIDAGGLVVAPGFIDMHAHFREPGMEHAETIASGARAAARGGFTLVLTMPNTTPPVDTPERVAWALRRAGSAPVAVRPAACMTLGRQGREPADLPALAAAGAAAFTDDGGTPDDEAVLRRVMVAAAALDRPVLDHAQSGALAGVGVMHAGAVAARLGWPGIPVQAETAAVERDIRLCAETGCRVHIQHLSSAAGAALLRAARARGLPVSGEATPHHLALIDADVAPGRTALKVNPPLRAAADREALGAAVADGTIQALATDHAPHPAHAKAADFRAAPFGAVGLETAVGVTYAVLVASGRMALADWVRRWTVGPAAILGLPVPGLAPGRAADLTLLDLAAPWTVRAAAFASRSRNTPFEGRRLTARAVYTFRRGVPVHRPGSEPGTSMPPGG
ncbi:MAG: dihydroorotase [Lentisphaerae bacterium]|nr:dihydroorotase [Lentisphaerota bacterium]